MAHFLVIGVLIFAAYSVTRPAEEATNPNRIEITQAQAKALAGQYRNVWNRNPDLDQLQKLIDASIREEALVRQARLLSLETGDPVIRARLARKMQFLIGSFAGNPEPEEAELSAYFIENRDRYAIPARLSFAQVYLGEAATADEASAAVSALNGGADPAFVGEGSLLPAGLSNVTTEMIDRTFGIGFGDAVVASPADTWSGPVQSGYGLHAVRLDLAEPARMPTLDEVRDRVADDWTRDQDADLLERQVAALLAGYQIDRPSEADLRAVLQ